MDIPDYSYKKAPSPSEIIEQWQRELASRQPQQGQVNLSTSHRPASTHGAIPDTSNVPGG